jgi:hypothetical protein
MAFDLFSFPFGFWLSLAALAAIAFYAWNQRNEAWGLPALAVCGTVMVWYHGDVLYNYKAVAETFSYEVVAAAWWQVVLFVASFALFAPLLHRIINPAKIGRTSTVMALLAGPRALMWLQRTLPATLRPLAAVWLSVNVVGLIRTDFDWEGMYMPWLGHLAKPWERGLVGGDIEFLWALFNYLNIFCLAGFGLIAALAKSGGVRITALALMALSWPAVLFDRTRNAMLAVLLPGLICLVCFRLRGHRWAQAGALVAAFLAISTWFAFVISARDLTSIAEAFAAGKFADSGEARHEGLNMFEELCWVNTFIDDGSFPPTWGRRYYAEAVSIVPRALWPNKPTLTLDYAIARGYGNASSPESVTCTVTTGMIGQGVNNFGPWGGPPAAALLASLWVALLARFDLTGYRLGRLPLYFLGLVLTFNLGRDITSMVAFPLLFGYAVVRLAEILRRPRRVCRQGGA